MTQGSGNIGIGRQLSRRLLPLSAGIWLLISVFPPLTYWIIEHHNLQHITALYAEDLAGKFRNFALEAPELWKYQTYKFITITKEFHPIIEVTGFSVLDEKGELISGYQYMNSWKKHRGGLTFKEEFNFSLGSAPILFNNRQVGTVEVLVSDAHLKGGTIILFCFSTLIGTTLAVLVYRYPIRAVRKMEGEIEELIAAVQKSEEKYRSLIGNIPDITWTADSEGNTIFISPNLARVYGYTPEEIYASGTSLRFGRIHPDDVERVTGAFESLFAHKGVFDVEYRIQRKDGEWIWFYDRATETYERGGIRYIDGISTEITDRKGVEEALKESETKFRNLVEKSLIGVYIIQDGMFRYVNPKLAEIFGWTVEEMVDKKGPADLVLPGDWPMVAENLRKRLAGEIKSLCYEFRGVTREKRVIDLEVFGSQIIYHGSPAVIGTLLDITARKRAEQVLAQQAQELRSMSLIDELTGLYNRRGFLTMAECQLKTMARMDKKTILIFIDLDGMKRINDTFGHNEGDAALKEVAFLLRETFRESDIAARLGGDEFVVLTLVDDTESSEILTGRLEQNLARRNAYSGKDYQLSFSLGASVKDPFSHSSIEELLEEADSLMYQRKKAKKAGHTIACYPGD
ncbi:MAG: sensory box/ggdef domain [Geobacteraceae bacterium]|nr:MAG: sensory box/ggdef domain [Geobacteraceae bacterium]